MAGQQDEQTPFQRKSIEELLDETEIDCSIQPCVIEQRRWEDNIWLVLQVVATLNGRHILRNVFPNPLTAYPYYFTLLIQLCSFATVLVSYLFLRLRFLSQRGKSQDVTFRWTESGLKAGRVLLSSSAAAVSMLFAAKAVFLYSSLPILVLLPFLSYISDTILFRLATTLSIISRDHNVSSATIYPATLLLLTGCIFILMKDEFKLNPGALRSALASFALSSLSRLFSKIGQHHEFKGDQSLRSLSHFYSLARIPPLLAATYAAYKYESITEASRIVKSWSFADYLLRLGPGVLLHVFFHSWFLSAHAFMSEGQIGATLEKYGVEARNSLIFTFQAGFCVTVLGALNKERDPVEWKQVILFTVIYAICLGPKRIDYQPSRLSAFRLFGHRKNLMHQKPRRKKIFLLITKTTLVLLLSPFIMFWVNSIAYKHDLHTWHDPDTTTLDTLYRPPEMRSVDIVIAHSLGDNIADIAWLIQAFASLPHYFYITPRVKIYTFNSQFPLNSSTAAILRGEFKGELLIQIMPNIGGPTAIYINHILTHWNKLPDHTLFLSTNGVTLSRLQNSINRLTWYYIPVPHPLPDALPKTGFLNLGPMAVCSCNNCFDNTGWSDTFRLVQSMWAATRTGNRTCDSVLLTYGNRFITSAERLRSVNRDIWQLLYDALVDQDINSAWAHAREKLPQLLDGEARVGPWADGEIFGEPDSLERPYLGFSIERLWSVLLQCSRPEVAWRCPSFNLGNKRSGSEKSDCGCID